MRRYQQFSSLFRRDVETKKRGENESPPRLVNFWMRRSGSDRFHRWDETDVRAANGALGGCHQACGFRGGSAAILFRAIEACARATWDADFFGDGFIAWDLFLNDLDHAAFTAFGIALGDHSFGDDVVSASFDLAGFGAVASAL